MAMTNRPFERGMIFHSDRGVQYASHLFSGILKQHHVLQSKSRKGNCWDNAVAENFFKILKSEMVKHSNFECLLKAKVEVFEFIEIWNNRRRKHSYLGYLSPQQFNETNYSKCA